MDCHRARSWLFQYLDDELSEAQAEVLRSHMDACPSCAKQLKILRLPRTIVRAIPAVEPSPYFYARLRARLRGESQSVTLWQVIMGLSRRVLPALASITLILLGAFAYFQLQEPATDVYQAYDSIFLSGDRASRMVIADPGDITDESVLRALIESETAPAGEPNRNGR